MTAPPVAPPDRTPQEVFLRRAIDLRRFENGTVVEITGLLRDLRDEIAVRLFAMDPTVMTGGFQRRRLEALLRQVNETMASAYRRVGSVARQALVGLAEHYIEVTNGDLQRATGAQTQAPIQTVELTPAQLRAIVDTQIVQGAVMADWWREQARDVRVAFERQMRMGLAQSETIDQLVRRVRGTSVGGGRFKGGIMDIGTRQAETLVRTAAAQVSTAAALEVLNANKDVADEVQWVSALDPRTCVLCMSRDGVHYPLAEAPKPPAHWACRCKLVPVIDFSALGIREPLPGTRAAAGGPMPEDATYKDWLNAQSAATQDEILGPARGKLWRAGEVTLQDLVTKEGRTLTLAELKARAN